MIYIREGRKQRCSNFLSCKREIPSSFWTAETGIEPIDHVISSINNTAYCHHIERLMILGNFMLLCDFSPHEVYEWFMALFIDSYDWVMVPNVYGMSQYSDGGIITTKPYVSSSNYVLKMSNFKKDNWCDIWDGLYWRFINKHKDFMLKNPRMSLMPKQLEKMDKVRKTSLLKNAEAYLSNL
jgi:deoxyribodipyrimidine photolyase-related protein